jgi:c-di-GMP-binding flagellar brake protein YcgR
MRDQYIEITSDGESILKTIQAIIDNRVVGKIEIPETKYSWITMILEIKRTKGSSFLTIEGIEGLESLLSKFPDQEVSLEFMDKGGVPCRFRTRVVECHPKDIWSELPKKIYRIQKRQFFRIETLPGTEITFRMGLSKQEKGEVKNLCEGGVAFFTEKDLKLNVGDLLKDITLNIPEGNEKLSFYIPRAVIRRMVKPSVHERRTLYGSEFLEMSEETRDKINAFIFQQHLVVIRKLKG